MNAIILQQLPYNCQQFYNKMSSKSNLATHITQETLNNLIETTYNIIKTNQFIRNNLVNYVIDKQADALKNLVHQGVFLPTQNVDREDTEANPLSEDNLMSINQVETNSLLNSDKESVKNSKNSTNTHLKNHNHNAVKKEPYKSIASNLNIQNTANEGLMNRQELIHISKLRDYKQKQRQQQINSPKEIQRPKIKLIKGQSYIFDYEGNLQKGNNKKAQKFNQSIIEANIDKVDKKASKIQEGQKNNKNMTIAAKLDRSVRNRTEIKGDIQFLGQQKRELMIKNLKLSNSKTKIVFDGQNITKTLQEAVMDTSNIKFERRKSSVQQTTINKTQPNLQKSMSISMSHSIELQQVKHKLRMNTQASEKHRKIQRINVENQALKSTLMTQPQDSYFELPKNRNRRAITHKAIEAQINDPDLIRIREKLNLKKSNEKLPKILSRYSNIEKDILRDIRKKSKISD